MALYVSDGFSKAFICVNASVLQVRVTDIRDGHGTDTRRDAT